MPSSALQKPPWSLANSYKGAALITYYLHLVGIHHILASPFHPQSNGKSERYHQSIKQDVNQLPYEMLADLEQAIVNLVNYYNYHSYWSVTPKLKDKDAST
jgi:putative transposase